MMELLISLIAVFSLMQPTLARAGAGVCFSVVTIAHRVFFGDLGGFAYYGSAGLAGMIITLMLCLPSLKCRLGLVLQKICLASIVLNALGYTLWFFYLDPAPYNMAFVGLYAAVALTMANLTPDSGSDGLGRGDNGIFSHVRKSLSVLPWGKAQT